MPVYVLRPHSVECSGCMKEDGFNSRYHAKKDVLILVPLKGSEVVQLSERIDNFDLPDYDPLQDA